MTNTSYGALVPVERHTKFWKLHLSMMPQLYTSGDDQRMTLGYFCLGALDLLNKMDAGLSTEQREAYIDWIYIQQMPFGGFRGSPAASEAHLTMTYTALLTLVLLRDNFARLDRKRLHDFVRDLQQNDGSHRSSPTSEERDVRFSYCAFAIAYIMDDWSMLDINHGISYMLRCQHYESAFAQQPGLESHGGSTYCVLASLALANRLENLPNKRRLQCWLLSRQVSSSGFQGRPEKEPDTCYSFWCGASTMILGCHQYVDADADATWILSAQSPMGGISKVPGEKPDVLHSYLSYVALAMHAQDCLAEHNLPFAPVSAALNLSRESLGWLQAHLWQRHPSVEIP
ncbi:hypothetical protein MVES_000306 [Malassezia vespertilionis]|uniref:Geranylgeranyl transferase type-1 subunit beta n=1 Tax=Malassezia vespertilionis TaxID=2020962 RepID=A0A2N1JFN7_9BASI|nr:hypothetical protein MVES_000306 [Malassezia vespertilionis]